MRVTMHEEHQLCLEYKKLRKVFVKYFHYKRFNCNCNIFCSLEPVQRAVNSLNKY